MLQIAYLNIQICNKIFQTKRNIFRDFSRTLKDQGVPRITYAIYVNVQTKTESKAVVTIR